MFTMRLPCIPVRDQSLSLSRIILGGHEYLPDGLSRAFNEDMRKAVTPGHIFPGFGGPARQALVERALALGITTFDVTIDSEKEALARNLAALGASASVVVQTRPEGMLYGYDPCNRKLIRPGVLRAEVARILELMRRDAIDILNIGILGDALSHDPGYLAALAEVLARLKDEGLIRCAAADSFSGEPTYLAMIETGAFDTLNVNFNIGDDGAARAVMPLAREKGVRIVAREVLMKGGWFRLCAELGIRDRALAARIAIKWVAARPEVDAIILGVDDAAQLEEGIAAALNPRMTAEEEDLLARITESEAFVRARRGYREAFIPATN